MHKMERQLFSYILLLLLAWTKAIEETSTTLIPATSTTDNKTAQQIGPAKLVQDSKSTNANDKSVQDNAPALTSKTKQEKSGNSVQVDHARRLEDDRAAEDRPIDAAEKFVEVAGPAPPTPPPHKERTERPYDVITPEKLPPQIGPGKFPKDSKSTNSNDKSTQDIAPALASKTKPEKSGNSVQVDHARRPSDDRAAEDRPIDAADKLVEVAGPAKPPPPPPPPERPGDVIIPSKSAQQIVPAKLAKYSKSTNANDKLVQDMAPAMASKTKPEKSGNSVQVDHARRPSDDRAAEDRPIDAADKLVEVAGPAKPPPPAPPPERPGDVIIPSKSASKIAPGMARRPSKQDTSDKPLHSVDHARQPQDLRPLYAADRQVQVAAPATPEESAAHRATENPKDVMTPGKSAHGSLASRLIVKREPTNSSSPLSDFLSPALTSNQAKNIRDLTQDEYASGIDPQTLKSSKREIQNVANILISSTKHIHNNKKDQQLKPKTPEDPKCPTLSEFINATQSLWNGLKTSDGVQGGLFSLFSAMSESVVVLAQCGLKLLNELGMFINQPSNLEKQGNARQEVKIDAGTNPGDKIIGTITVTEDPNKGDSEPLITLAPTVDNVDVEPTEKNLVNLDVDVSVISATNNKTDTGSFVKEFVETTPSNTIVVETNVSKTEVVETNLDNPINGYINKPQTVVVETNVTQTDLVDLNPQNPVVLETNFTRTEVVDGNSSKLGNVQNNQSVDLVVVDTNILKPVTENVPTKSPNVFTVNVFSIDKAQKFYPSVLAHGDKVKMDKVDNLSDYDYGDYSAEKVDRPEGWEDLKKKKRAGSGYRRWRNRFAKSLERKPKKP